MSMVFIAVHCFQCSTMQVKQQKKSSNKWTCVVCNQKQSVRKVFAQGYKAKEIRLFVQNFNMSRQFTDQLRREETETLDIGEQNLSCGSSKRTDWTEYLDAEEDAVENNENVSGDVMEPKVVTELPKELFRRSILKNYSAVEGNFKPVFSKRNARKQSISQGQGYWNAQNTGVEPSKRHATMAPVISKWRDNRTAPLDISIQPATDGVCNLDEAINLYTNENYKNEGDRGYGKSVQRIQLRTANKVSKWTEYITEDEDDCHSQFARGRGFTSELNEGISLYNHVNYINDEGNPGYSKSEQRIQPKTANKVSKWTEYITEGEDDCHSQYASGRGSTSDANKWRASGRGSTSDVNKWRGNTFETSLKDQRLDDEEIHPDFL